MEKAIALFIAALCLGGCSCQETTTEPPSDDAAAVEPIETAACVFGCLESFERRGVQGDTKDMSSMELEGSVCDKLNLDTLVGMCNSYLKSGTCVSACVNSPTKTIITSGLDYICKVHLNDFRKYMPCLKQTCPSMEQQCAGGCGMDLAKAQEQWMEQLGVNGSFTGSQKPSPRRRRQTLDSSSIVTPTTTQSTDGSGVDEVDPLGTCQFVKCYMNCSRPILENACGKEAYDLLIHTSNILLSFVMAPLEESWEAGTNTTLSDTMATCDRYFSQALTDEGVDRSVLKGATSRPTYNVIWSILLSAALVLVFRF